MSDSTRLVWLDLETTGLDPSEGVILEIAAVVTDRNLFEFASVEHVCGHRKELILPMMDEYVQLMHYDSGLLEEVYRSMTTVTDAMRSVMSVIEGACGTSEKPHLAGNSISFDRGWLRAHMPDLERMFHYRLMDVSAYKVGFPSIFDTGERPGHRSMVDVRYSMSQHRKMRALLGDYYK